jgi:hypothetical protein
MQHYTATGVASGTYSLVGPTYFKLEKGKAVMFNAAFIYMFLNMTGYMNKDYICRNLNFAVKIGLPPHDLIRVQLPALEQDGSTLPAKWLISNEFLAYVAWLQFMSPFKDITEKHPAHDAASLMVKNKIAEYEALPRDVLLEKLDAALSAWNEVHKWDGTPQSEDEPAPDDGLDEDARERTSMYD